MADTYFTRWEYSINQKLIGKTQIAMVSAAISIQAEDVETANHANRSAFARQVLQSPMQWAETMAVGVATELSAIDPDDATLDSAVAAIWDAYAGVL